MITPAIDNRLEADRFAHWYARNREYLARTLCGTYGYDEDVPSEVFSRIYVRMLDGVRIKDYMPYMVRAIKYGCLSRKRKTGRLVPVDNYDTFKNIAVYESETDPGKLYGILDRIVG